jgi:hypothetical protein
MLAAEYPIYEKFPLLIVVLQHTFLYNIRPCVVLIDGVSVSMIAYQKLHMINPLMEDIIIKI